MLLETISSFCFRRFAPALIAANADHLKHRILDLLAQAIWQDEWEMALCGEVTEAWVMHGMLPHPMAQGGQLSPQPHPIARTDILRALYECRGLPNHPDLRAIAARMTAAIHPALARTHADREQAFLALRTAAWADYPADGRTMICRIVLPYRRLEAFCRGHDLRAPDVLKDRLAGRWIDSRKIAPPIPAKGRPAKHVDRYLRQFHTRIECGEVSGSPMHEARILRSWLREIVMIEGLAHDDGALPSEKTIRNKLIAIFDFDRRTFRSSDVSSGAGELRD